MAHLPPHLPPPTSYFLLASYTCTPQATAPSRGRPAAAWARTSWPAPPVHMHTCVHIGMGMGMDMGMDIHIWTAACGRAQDSWPAPPMHTHMCIHAHTCIHVCMHVCIHLCCSSTHAWGACAWHACIASMGHSITCVTCMGDMCMHAWGHAHCVCVTMHTSYLLPPAYRL